jgi:hypothetical protein
VIIETEENTIYIIKLSMSSRSREGPSSNLMIDDDDDVFYITYNLFV